MRSHYWVWSPWSSRSWSSRCWWGGRSWTGRSAARPTRWGRLAERTLVTTSGWATWRVDQGERRTLRLEPHRKAKYCIFIPCLLRSFSTSGSICPILVWRRTIMAWIPVEESSRVLMKKSLMSDIRFVKQKKQSASAWSVMELGKGSKISPL